MDDFTQFVATRYGELLRTAYLLTGSRHAAEDLVQASLLAALSHWEELRDPLYLRRTMVNLRISRWRRLRRELLTRSNSVDARYAAALDNGLLSAMMRVTCDGVVHYEHEGFSAVDLWTP